MDDLAAFLRARLDEDERLARRAAELCGCHPPAPSWHFEDGDGPTDGRIVIADDPHPNIKRKLSRRWNSTYEGLFAAEHIARHDPSRVLAEVEAKRKTLDLYEEQSAKRHENAMEEDRAWVLAPVITLLALPYADHPDYREEWKP